jgi:hypothetical protein
MMSSDDRIAALEARVAALETKSSPRPAAPSAAGADDLDSTYGNFVVRKNPPRWKGTPIDGKRLSECEPDALDALAGYLEWVAGKKAEEGKEKYAAYDRRDAARARGWAARLREGWSGGASGATPGAEGADDDFCF